MSYNLRDTQLKVTKALPAAGAEANTDALDLQNGTTGDFVVPHELLISIPALANLVDTKTVIVDIEESADNSSWSDYETAVITMTGASGAGAAAATATLKLRNSVKRYIRAEITVAASGGDNTGSSLTMELLF